MKCTIFLVVASLALVSSDDVPNPYIKASAECNADPKTAYDLPKSPPDALRPRDPPKFPDYSSELGAYTFCVYKKMGIMTETGDIVEAKYRSWLNHYTSDEAEMNEIVQKCLAKKDTPKQTGYSIFSCAVVSLGHPKRSED